MFDTASKHTNKKMQSPIKVEKSSGSEVDRQVQNDEHMALREEKASRKFLFE